MMTMFSYFIHDKNNELEQITLFMIRFPMILRIYLSTRVIYVRLLGGCT
jgi:hypothetical protein